MSVHPKVLAFVLAGGKGTRLYPLTAEQAKPALPFARGRRIVDFVLSNLVHSRIERIYVLAQYKPRSLVEHIDDVWARWSRGENPLISVRLPEGSVNGGSFDGTADAVRQNLDLLQHHRPDIVAVFAADHIYRMDVRHMVHLHRQRDADATIAAVPVPIEEASSFGILRAGVLSELLEFQEKPQRAKSLPGDPARAFASMGNYLFRPRTLVELLENGRRPGGTDFGRDVLPGLPARGCAYVYDFSSNTVPGTKPYEEHAYWRDVGTLDAYLSAQRDLSGPLPSFDLDNTEWPIHCGNGLLGGAPLPTVGTLGFAAAPLRRESSVRPQVEAHE